MFPTPVVLVHKTESRDREDVQKTGGYDLVSSREHCFVSFLFFFRDGALSLQNEERERLARDSFVKMTTILPPDFGRAKSAIGVAKPPPPSAPSAVWRAPSAGQSASKYLEKGKKVELSDLMHI